VDFVEARTNALKLSPKLNHESELQVGYQQPIAEAPMDAVFLELQIQIRVGETTGTPMQRLPIHLIISRHNRKLIGNTSSIGTQRAEATFCR